jgi:hypothetical protein
MSEPELQSYEYVKSKLKEGYEIVERTEHRDTYYIELGDPEQTEIIPVHLSRDDYKKTIDRHYFK